MAGIGKQIIGSFEQIGKDVARETAKVPTEVVGQALESMGASAQNSKQVQQTQAPPKENEPEKPRVPREWLAELAGKGKKQKELSIHEKLIQEEEKKKEMLAKQAAAEQQFALKPISTKQRRGMLYGAGGKKAAAETKTAFRQD